MSLLFFQDPTTEGQPDCQEICEQVNATAPKVCETVCQAPEEVGLWVLLLSLLVTVPVSTVVDRSFKWLRSPVVTAVEQKKVTVGSLIRSARAAQKTVFDEGRKPGEKVLDIGRQLSHLQENEGACATIRLETTFCIFCAAPTFLTGHCGS